MADVVVDTAARDVASVRQGRLVRVLHVVEGFDHALGGTVAVVRVLAGSLAASGIDVSVLGLAGEGRTPADRTPMAPGVVDHACRPVLHRRLGFSLELRRWLREARPFDVVHVHGLWRLHYLQVARDAIERGVPVVVSTHGMLEPWALAQKKWAKRLARLLYQDRVLRQAVCLHATALSEARNLRALGLDTPIAVSPPGITLPPGESRSEVARHARRVLFLSRLHPKKGVDTLLRAWGEVHREFPDWMLVVAGYDDDGYRSGLVDLAAELGIAARTIFAGPKEGPDKDDVFRSADLFVLPSHSENFGLVIAEALAHGIPVITTTATPWSALVDERCGWWVELGVRPLVQTLREALAMRPADLDAMGQRGRTYVEHHLSGVAATRRMGELYMWVSGRGERPAFVSSS